MHNNFSLIKWLLISIIFLTASCASNHSLVSSSSSVVIRSTGTGISVEEAQDNALRNAVQTATGVLTVTERRIEDEKLSEKNLSYSKGMVEDFKVLNTSRNPKDKLFYVEAEVVVSPSRFYSRVISASDSSKIDGYQLNKSILQVKEQVKSQDQRLKQSEQFLEFVLENLPKSADSKVEKILVSRDGYATKAIVRVNNTFSRSVLKSLCNILDAYSLDFNALDKKTYRTNFSVNDKWNCVRNYPIPGYLIAKLNNDLRQYGTCLNFVNAQKYTLTKLFYDKVLPVPIVDNAYGIPWNTGDNIYQVYSFFKDPIEIPIDYINEQVLKITAEIQSKVSTKSECL
jgi:hypothetical protein